MPVQSVTRDVRFHDEFDDEFEALSEDVQDNLLAAARAMQIAGPKAGRPHVDTLDGSKHANMKELRFTAHGGREVWRAAFAFDPERMAILLVAGDKQGKNQKLFYKRLVKIADRRFDSHLVKVAAGKSTKR
jgi:hypothetical protein